MRFLSVDDAELWPWIFLLVPLLPFLDEVVAYIFQFVKWYDTLFVLVIEVLVDLFFVDAVLIVVRESCITVDVAYLCGQCIR